MKIYHQVQAIAATSSSTSTIGDADHNSAPTTVHAHCLIVVLPGPMLAFERDMSTVEELRLLKAQVSDLARACNAVARGDLCQKVTVPVHGVVMVQLRSTQECRQYYGLLIHFLPHGFVSRKSF